MSPIQSLILENEYLRAEVSTLGAELCALLDKKHGFPVLKMRDDPFWDGVAPVLFPICGRLWEKTTYVSGTPYHMGTHGFAADSTFSVKSHSKAAVALTLTDNDIGRIALYPFRFLLTVEYILDGASLLTRVTVENRDAQTLPFSIGFHPAFTLPFGENGGVEDCHLDFPNATETKIWELSPGALLTGNNLPYPLRDGHILPITNDLLAEIDSIFFIGSGNTVTLASCSSDRKIRIDYDGFPYLGLWRPSDPSAHFLCIEPWYGSPDTDKISTELSEKQDMILLPPAATHTVSYRVTAD